MIKRFVSLSLTLVLILSMVPFAFADSSVSAFSSGGNFADFVTSLSFTGMGGGGSFGGGAGCGMGGGSFIKGAGAGRGMGGGSFGGGAGRNDFGSGFSKNYGLNLTGSGAKNNFLYNDISITNNISIYNDTVNTYYNPVTNNYNTYNNISYNNSYNTYFMQGSNYNTYVTNNGTYLSYYVIENSTQETYYYEIYYQLPDGRNSYDLEPEDVWGTYFIYNATNYREVAEDDGVTLGLWHLDGDIKNAASSGFSNSLQNASNRFVETPFSGGLSLSTTTKDSFYLDLTDDVQTVEFRVKYSVGGGASGIPVSFGSATIKGTSCNYSDPAYKNTTTINKTLYGLFYDYSVSNGRPVSAYEKTTDRNQWLSIALCRNNSETWRLFVNGNNRGLYYSGSKDYQFNESYDLNGRTYETTEKISIHGGNRLYFYNTTSLNSVYSSVIYDEIRLSNKVLYTSDYTPRTQPFDTNKVLVVPDTADMTDTTIAVKSSVPVAGLRVGGVRPTYPTNGDVYVVEENGVVKDVQQYQSDGWYSVTASLYIDGKWRVFVGFDISGFVLNEPDTDAKDPCPCTVSSTTYGKNLLGTPYNGGTVTTNGLTITDNGDGSLTINGTATANTKYELAQTTLPAGKYVLGGLPSRDDAGLRIAVDGYLDHSGKDYTFDLDSSLATYVNLRIQKGAVFKNFTFTPYIRKVTVKPGCTDCTGAAGCSCGCSNCTCSTLPTPTPSPGDSGDDSGSSGGFLSKILNAVFGGILAVFKALIKALLTLLGTILSELVSLIGYVSVFLPFLDARVTALIGSGVFIVLALVVVKFIGGLL